MMIIGLILGLSVLFLVIIGLCIPKIYKSKLQFKGETLAVLCFIAAIIISANMFSISIYIDDAGTTLKSFDIEDTYVELDLSNDVYKNLIIAYNDNGVTLNECYDRIFGDYHNSNSIEIRQDALGTKAVFV